MTDQNHSIPQNFTVPDRFTRGDTLFHPDGRVEIQIFGRLGDTTIQVAGPVRTPAIEKKES